MKHHKEKSKHLDKEITEFNYEMKRTLKDRIKLARKQRLINKGFSTCKCCNVSINTIKHKYVSYKIDTNGRSSGWGPLCVECFYDPEVPFEDILNYYTNRTIYPNHPNKCFEGSSFTWAFTESEVNTIIDNLINEIDNGDPIHNSLINQIGGITLKEKFITEQRDNKLNTILQ